MEPNSNQKDASARTKQERPELLTSKNRFRALLDINNAIISILNKQDLFHAIAKTLKENFPVDCTAVTLYNEKKDVFEVLSIEPFSSSVELYSGFEMPHKDSHSVGRLTIISHLSPKILRKNKNSQPIRFC